MFQTIRSAAFTMVAATGLLFLSSCGKNEVEVQQSIVDIVVSNPNFSILRSAVVKADIVNDLQQSNLTVFAPDNDAMQASGITQAVVDALPASDLAFIVKYHVLGASITSGQLVTGLTDGTTLIGRSLFVSKNANGVFANGIRVKQADISARNGVIHVVERLLTPPAGNLAEVAIASPSHKRLVQAVVKCNLVSALTGTNRLTVFAPTDAAFAAAGFDSTAIANASPATVNVLRNVILFHVVPSVYVAADIQEGLTLETAFPGAAGPVLTFSLSGGAKVRGNGNPSGVFANITAANLPATNGMIHVVDRVLLP